MQQALCVYSMLINNADVLKVFYAVQAWMAAVQESTGKGTDTGTNAAGVAAAAMFVLVVTRTNDEWASWSEEDNTFVRSPSLLCYHCLCWASLSEEDNTFVRLPASLPSKQWCDN